MEYQYNYSELDERHKNFSYDEKLRTKKANVILRVIQDFSKKDLKNLNALDIGCAAGFTVQVLSKELKQVTGIDIDKPAIEYCKKNIKPKNTRFILIDGLNYPIPDNSFDIVVCNQIYEHVPDPKKLMTEIHRILKQDGFCYFGACNKYIIIEPHYRLPFLSFLPKKLADIYLYAFRKKKYYETLLSFKNIMKLLKNFKVTDYTTIVIKNPVKFGIEHMINPKSILTKLKPNIIKKLYFFIPNYILILEKKDNLEDYK